MDNDINSLSHTMWNCKYHIVWAPKYRRKIFYHEKREVVGKIIRELCEQKPGGIDLIKSEIWAFIRVLRSIFIPYPTFFIKWDL